MAAPGRISKEIWQVHQVAVKLHISFFFFVQIAARWVAVKLHISFFFFKMAAPGRISKEIWQVHQVAVKLHISFFFFVQIAARWVAVKLHISFFFFKMAAPGRIGKEIWQAHQVAVKLHISVFFFFSNFYFRHRPRAVHGTSAQFHTATLRKSKVFTQNLQCTLLKSESLTKEVCKNSYRRGGLNHFACPTVRCCMVLQAGLPPCEG